MKRTELACYLLLASAFILGGLLVGELNRRGGILPQADAEMVLTRGNLTLMTAKTRKDEEALFVLDNYSQRMMIFTVDLGKKRMELALSPISLKKLFRGDDDDDDNHRRRRGR